jgi:hypothetical protein
MPAERRWHLLGDVPALFLAAIVLAGLLVWSDTAKGNDRAALPAVTPYLQQRSLIGTPASGKAASES